MWLRKPGQSITEFLNDLHKLSEFCNLGETLENRLSEQLVFGIQGGIILQKILNSKSLTLETAMDLALSFKLATQGVKSLNFREFFSMNKIGRPPLFQQQKYVPFVQKEKRREAKYYSVKPCCRCLKHYEPKECPFKNA